MSREETNPNDLGNEKENGAEQLKCNELLDLLPAYSIEATDRDEDELVAAALASHPDSADELAEYEHIRQALLHSAEPRSPSPALAESLQAAIRQEAAPESQPQKDQSVAWLTQLFGGLFQPTWTRLAVAGVLLLLLALNGVTALRMWKLQAENQMLVGQLTSQLEALTVITDPDAEVYTLSAPDDGGDAHASVRWMPGNNVAVLTAEDFPELQSDMAYQLWLIRDGQRTSGGLFDVDSEGAGTLVVIAPEPMDTFDSMGVTPEPAAGSAGPTSPPVVFGTL